MCRTVKGMMSVVGDISELLHICLEALYHRVISPIRSLQSPNSRTGDMPQSRVLSSHHCDSCISYRCKTRPLLCAPLPVPLRLTRWWLVWPVGSLF
ncbi:hypothetical protein BDZ85DRAFT_111174 [Elsinoe ampelina]|uniref:Uncharacterized protein n=1 Tax=Elsinoe ampelina TaxID=302913 RepID=A0A6A6GCZ7_9PEZI|nr:hypothetical protein BDZ85DRAFT_111174 [Elsinoe ampelina]